MKTINISDKLILRIKPDLKIYYVNDDFLKFTGFDESQILLHEITDVLPDTMPDLYREMFAANIKPDQVSYFIIKGKTADNDNYWGLLRITPFESKLNGEKRYLVEIKMLPLNAVKAAGKVFETVEKIYDNTGMKFAKKYLEGFLEEKNMDFEKFIFDILGVSKKKVDKYFKI